MGLGLLLRIGDCRGPSFTRLVLGFFNTTDWAAWGAWTTWVAWTTWLTFATTVGAGVDLTTGVCVTTGVGLTTGVCVSTGVGCRLIGARGAIASVFVIFRPDLTSATSSSPPSSSSNSAEGAAAGALFLDCLDCRGVRGFVGSPPRITLGPPVIVSVFIDESILRYTDLFTMIIKRWYQYKI